METPIDYEFRHHLYDTLILLGANQGVADLLRKSKDYLVTDADIEELRRYNIELLESTKRRLTQINTIAIRSGE